MVPRFSAEASLYRTTVNYVVIPFQLRCDLPGRLCCAPDASVKTLHCEGTVGCNVVTGRCESCGGVGQVCCDGPFTDFSNKSYTGISIDSTERFTSCDAGLRCDATSTDGINWVGTRRCQQCGSREGGLCCAPDDHYAFGRCNPDSQTGKHLACDVPYSAQGTCVACEPLCYRSCPRRCGQQCPGDCSPWDPGPCPNTVCYLECMDECQSACDIDCADFDDVARSFPR